MSYSCFKESSPITSFLFLRSTVLRRAWLRKLRQKFHGPGRRSQPVPLSQLSVCAERPQTDAGQRDWPQCLPAGHVQEEVSGSSRQSCVFVVLTFVSLLSEMVVWTTSD